MKLKLVEVCFLICSFSLSYVFCGKLDRVELDFTKSRGDYLQKFEDTITEHMDDVISVLENDDTAEISYEIKPPTTIDNNTDRLLLKLLEKTISKLAPTLEYKILSEETTERVGRKDVVTLIEYEITFLKANKRERTLYIDNDEDLANNKTIINFIDSLYDDYEKSSEANYSIVFKIDLPTTSSERSAEKVRKEILKIFHSKKRKLEKDYKTDETSSFDYNSKKQIKGIDYTIDFIRTNKLKKSSNENDDYDFAFEPIQIANSDEAIKRKIIDELLRHIKESKQKWFWNRSNVVLFKFEIPREMTSSEVTQLVEDVYLDLEDIEPNCKINPALIKEDSFEIKVELPSINSMSVIKFDKRFPHVIDGSMPIEPYKDRSVLKDRIEEILEYQLFMAKRRDSGEKVHLDLIFTVPKGRSERNDSDFVQKVIKYLKEIEIVKIVSYEWKDSGRTRKKLLVQVGMPYSVSMAHGGVRVKAEAQERKGLLRGLVSKLF